MTYPLQLELPPTNIVKFLGEKLQPHAPRRILDAGAGLGRNARFLTDMGHWVVSLDSRLEELGTSITTPKIVASVQRLPFGTAFDIALMNEVTHLLPSKYATNKALAELRRVTYQGGLNVVSGYLALAGQTNARNAAHMFQGDELRSIYAEAGWNVLYYDEKVLPNQYIGQGAAVREIVSSHAMIIAQRLWM